MRIDNIWFKDDCGRTLILRGANISGSTKVPYHPDGATYRLDDFFDHRNVSFVGRPFPLEEADEHFSRLKNWGLTFLRFLITWEAVEHYGPREYDQEYLDSLYAVINKAGEHGIDVFIDPHQDVWSRWTGGDGAPVWTLEAVGMDLSRLSGTGAAISHPTHGDPYPRMIWPSNSTKLGSATMFTLFFGGNDFAPKTMVEGLPVQEYLQDHYIQSIRQVALKLKGLSNVAGFDSLNEPGGGYIGTQNLNQWNQGIPSTGISPTPFQGMLAGSGYAQDVDVLELGPAGLQKTDTETINPDGLSLWAEGRDCVWRENGVWTVEGDEPRLLRPDYFSGGEGRNLNQDYLKPFIKRLITEVREVEPKTIIFLEGSPGSEEISWDKEDPSDVVNASHWYDIMTLFTKQYNPDMTIDLQKLELVQGAEAVRQSFANQLAAVKDRGTTRMGGVPTLIGEFGIPFDMNGKKAYEDGDFSSQVQALDASYSAMEANLLNSTIWNYTPDNTNERGDKWNDEDLSIFSRDQQDDPADISSGGRALEAVVRPYARKTAGEPISMGFDLASRIFTFEFKHDPSVSEPTEIFVPEWQYPGA